MDGRHDGVRRGSGVTAADVRQTPPAAATESRLRFTYTTWCTMLNTRAYRYSTRVRAAGGDATFTRGVFGRGGATGTGVKGGGTNNNNK